MWVTGLLRLPPVRSFGLFVLGLSKVLHDLGSKILVQFNELQFGFVDFAACFRDGWKPTAHVPVETCRLALQAT